MTDNSLEMNMENQTCVTENKIKQEADESIEDDISISKDMTIQNTHLKTDNSVKIENKSDGKHRGNRKRKRVRGKRRSKRQKLMINIAAESPSNDLEPINSSETEDEFCLKVSNFPNNWSLDKIKNYIDTACGTVDEIELVESKIKDGSQSVRLLFPTKVDCDLAKEKLKNKIIEGNRIIAEIEDYWDSVTEVLSNTDLAPSEPWGQDIWEEDPAGMYGLKSEFLKSLDLKPPLTKWVCVTNFRCDKVELRDVLELAGHVLMCSVFTGALRFARVQYSHPLEAVQAISMLNGQFYYGKKLKVIMDKCTNDITILPKGLNNIGLGLGIKGQPLRNVVKNYKRHTMQKSSHINPVLFTSTNSESNSENASQDFLERVKEIKIHIDKQKTLMKFKSVEDSSNFKVKVDKDDSDSDDSVRSDKKINEIKTISTITRKVAPERVSPISKGMKSAPVRHLVPAVSNVSPSVNGMTSNVPNQPGPPGIAELPLPRPMVRPNPGIPRPGFTGSAPIPRPGAAMGPRPIPGPVAGPVRGPMPGQFGHGPRPPMPNNMGSGQGPYTGPRHFGPQAVPNPNSASVRMRNLPLSTTFTYLCEKLSQCGQVVSLQLTEPGCALVTFGSRTQAERCYQTFNRLQAENCIIEVQFI